MKRLVLLGMVLLLAGGWYKTVRNLAEKPAYYEKLLKKADRYENNELYIRAIEFLEEAQTYKNTEETDLRLARDYRLLGKTDEYEERMKEICSSNGYRTDTVCELADYYENCGNISEEIGILKKGLSVHPNNEEISIRYESVRYTYTNVYCAYDDMKSIRNGTAVVTTGNANGMINKTGKAIAKVLYKKIAPLSDDAQRIVACDERGWFISDTNGYKREVPKENQTVEYVGTLYGGIAPAEINGKWCYINEEFDVLSTEEWDFATVLYNGIGAVKKGEKWALVNSSMELITDYKFDDVVTDEYGFCSMSGRVFVKENGKYRIIDTTGNYAGSNVYDEAKIFVGGGPAAVKRDGLWGFADEAGNEVIAPLYLDAYSFASGLAPVKTKNGWGYIDLQENLQIEDGFEDALPFEKGYAPVKSNGSWTILKLNSY